MRKLKIFRSFCIKPKFSHRYKVTADVKTELARSRLKQNMNKHLEKWQPTARKQLVAYPVGLRKTLSEIYYSSTTNNSSSNKMSINSYLLYQLHLCQKCHLEMRSMKQKKMVLIILKALTRKKTNSNQKNNIGIGKKTIR